MPSEENPGRNWCFTLNNPTDEEDPKEWGATFLVYQKEKGQDGTEHYQGYLELHKAQRLAAMKKLNGRAHWEKRKKTAEDCVAYCTKEDTRIDGPWTVGKSARNQGQRTDLDSAAEAVQAGATMDTLADSHPVTYIKYTKGLKEFTALHDRRRMLELKRKAFETADLRPWQQHLADKLNKPANDRTIMWYWEEEGNVGKTWFARYMSAKHSATVLDVGKKIDMCYCLKDHKGASILFNITRTQNLEHLGYLYGLAECIKDDMVTSYKYMPVELFLGPQHVVVFANFPPDTTKWSQDRYDVHQIGTEGPFEMAAGPPKKKQCVSPKSYVKKDGTTFHYAGGNHEAVGLAACTSRTGGALPVTAENNPGLFRAESPNFLPTEPAVPYVDLLRLSSRLPVPPGLQRPVLISSHDQSTFVHPGVTPNPIQIYPGLDVPLFKTNPKDREPACRGYSRHKPEPPKKKRSVYCPKCDAYKPEGHSC